MYMPILRLINPKPLRKVSYFKSSTKSPSRLNTNWSIYLDAKNRNNIPVPTISSHY